MGFHSGEQQRHNAGAAHLPIVLRCSDHIARKVRYVFDTILMAAGIRTEYRSEPPPAGPWVFYTTSKGGLVDSSCVAIAHCPSAWELFEGRGDVNEAVSIDDLSVVLPHHAEGFDPNTDIRFDLVVNAFYFLASWSERATSIAGRTRQLHADSVFTRLRLPQDIVDRYMQRLLHTLRTASNGATDGWLPLHWPGDHSYTLVLSHDVDFLPTTRGDVAWQGVKTAMRHLVRERNPADALRATAGLVRASCSGRDPYGCVPEIIARERELGVRSSFQVAVARRDPRDVNYRIDDERVRGYLRRITEAGFELCLHGSYRSTEDIAGYLEEVEHLTRCLGRPLGSRQHFLSFDYDTLFAAQEKAGIRYDMSMGYPDRIGPRAGFSYPYFPYCLRLDRPYDVLQISLFLMDVTLRGYMRLRAEPAWDAIQGVLDDLQAKRGCVSIVWHPIVFGGARDPGYDELYWSIVKHVRKSGGLATDGRTIDAFWRRQARGYASFDRDAGDAATGLSVERDAPLVSATFGSC